jgi:hypothetical protein
VTVRSSTATRTALALALVAVGLALGYAVIRESVAHLIARRDPAFAELLWPPTAEARDRAAQVMVANAVTKPEIGEAEKAAVNALKAAPLSITALRSVALVRALELGQPGAAPLMRLAGQRNLRDPQIQLWLFQDAIDARRYAEAFARADIVLRRRPEAEALVFPRFMAALNDPTAGPALVTILSTAPPWREDFIRDLVAITDPAAAPTRLLQTLARSARPPTDTEVLHVTNALVTSRRYDEARRVWTDLVSRTTGEQGLVYNGDFERPTGAPPFDWQLAEEGGVLGQILSRAGEGRALFVEFPAGRRAEPARQLVVLPRGAPYRLTGMAMVEQLPGDAGVKLTLSCADDGKLIAEYTLRTATAWRSITVDFTTPPEGCGAQWLTVRGELGASLNTVRAWFDKIAISKLS